MFNTRKEETGTTQSFSMQGINNIGKGTIIEGNVFTEGDIRIDGKVNGNIQSKSRVVLGQTSEVKGDVNCKNGNIEGKVLGNVNVKEVLKITSTANVDGNIMTKKLVVDEGALVQAKITMSDGSNNITKSASNPTHRTVNQNIKSQ